MNHGARLGRLGEALGELELDALVVAAPANLRYLTGYTGSNGVLIALRDRAVFFTDFRYFERSAPMRAFLELEPAPRDLYRSLGRRLRELVAGGRAGFEEAHLTVARHQALAADSALELVGTRGVVERLRAVKDAEELDAMRAASAVLEPVLEALAAEGLAGRRETDVAWRIVELFHQAGAQGESFPAIVASAENGAYPHAEPRPVEIPPGTLVTIDLGCVLDGYASDCTRTFATGPLPGALRELYDVCLDAQLRALPEVRAGARGCDVDAVARTRIAEAGHGEAFGHPLGHGVGVEVHEEPRLAPGNEAPLEPGNVVSVEPGIYLAGVGGVRIEDLVIVGADGPERMTGFTKDLVTVG